MNTTRFHASTIRTLLRRRKLINTPTQASMHPAQLRCSSVEWLAIRPSRALLDGRLVTRVGVFINLRRLKKQKIATIDELKAALGSQTAVTVFRKLAELSYLTSYSHGARYYTLEEIARFNQDGLWSCDSVWFSSHGTLLSTLERFIDSAEAGYYGPELRERLHVEVNSSLLKLITQGKVLREKVDGMYLYCSADPVIHERQLASRKIAPALEGTRGIILSNDWVSDEIKAAIILFFSLLDEKQRRLFAGLESIQFGHGGDTRIADLLGIDPHTVSKGRQQILEQDSLAEGIRKPGAGRLGVKKNAPDIVK